MFTPSSYPHIFDDIVEDVDLEGDHQTLLHLRVACKRMRYMADAILFDHAVITTSNTMVTVRSHTGLPAISIEASDTETESDASLVSVLGHISVVDIKGVPPP